ncbi:WD40_repeat protein [Hexamita inflata]|uniref:WD40 repeat protein n=1 Tax=Hexamita inflata TaxID=28002 RepID=A0AA86PD08_9EUKA|nr:WD40 repeat protein [Hexamita inflata]
MDFEYKQSLYFRKLGPEKIDITAYVYAPDKNMIFGGLSNGTIIAWDLCISIPVARVCVVAAHGGPISVLHYNQRTGYLISGGMDHMISIWDPILSDLVDVSGVEKLKPDPLFAGDRFYIKHGGTVQSPVLPDDSASSSQRKSVLIQQFAEAGRMICGIVEVPRGFVALSQDGSAILFVLNPDLNLKYQQFSVQDKIYLGYEQTDVQRQMEVMALSQTDKQIYGQTTSEKQTEIKTVRGRELQTQGQATLSAKIYPSSGVVNKDDGNLFIGDSYGEIHIVDASTDSLKYKNKLGKVHRLGISQLCYLERENTLISASTDGVCRGLVGATGQVNFTFYNQRAVQYRAISFAQRSLGSDEGFKQKTTEELQAEATTLENAKMDSLNDLNMKIRSEQLVILLDAENYITVIEANHGQVLLDQPFADIVPNLGIIQQDLEKYNIDTAFPIVCDFRSSKNASMYAVQKQNTSTSDEYKMLKQNYQRKQGEIVIQHPFMSLYEDQQVVGLFQFDQAGQQNICFVRGYCLSLYGIKQKDKQSSKKVERPVRLMGLLLVSIQQKNYQNDKIIVPRAESEPGDVQNALMQDYSMFQNSSQARSKSPFRQFMNKYRLKQVQLKRINQPINKLGALTPYLPDDLDAIESFIKNNMQEGELPEFHSPDRKGIQEQVTQMSVPFYVIMATEDNVINNFDPRVIRRPYHVYQVDFNVLMNAIQVDYANITNIVGNYKKIVTTQSLTNIQTAESFIKKRQLPKVQPILSTDNVFSRLAKPKTKSVHMDVKKETEYKFYHTQGTGYDNQHDLGLNDQDITYNITEDPSSLKNDVNKMNLEVKKVSELPDSICFDLMVDTNSQFKRDLLVFGHEDGSITFQDLLSGQLLRCFGGHSLGISQIVHAQTTAGWQVISWTPDGKFLSLQIPRGSTLRVQYLSHSIFKGEQIQNVAAGSQYLLIGSQTGKVWVSALPLQYQLKTFEIFDMARFFQFKKLSGKPDIHSIVIEEGNLFLLSESGMLLVFFNINSDIDQWAEQFTRGGQISLKYSQSKLKYKDYLQSLNGTFTVLPDLMIQLTTEKEIISTFMIASPMQRGGQILKELKDGKVNKNIISEMLEEEISARVIAEQKLLEEKAHKLKFEMTQSKHLKPRSNITVESVTQDKREVQIDEQKLRQIGNQQFIYVSTNTKLVKIFKLSGEVLQIDRFDSMVTSLVSINRGPIGERILSQLAEIGGNEEFLSKYWVGMADGTIGQGDVKGILE